MMQGMRNHRRLLRTKRKRRARLCQQTIIRKSLGSLHESTFELRIRSSASEFEDRTSNSKFELVPHDEHCLEVEDAPIEFVCPCCGVLSLCLSFAGPRSKYVAESNESFGLDRLPNSPGDCNHYGTTCWIE